MKRLNERHEPFELQQLSIVRRRTSSLPVIDEEYARLVKGFNGEKNVDFHLSFLPNDYRQLCQIRLAIDGYFAQFDSLVFSPTTLYIAEAKALEKTVHIDHQKQLLTTSHHELKSPLLQAEQQAIRLRAFAAAHQLVVPIEPLVIFSDKTTNIQQVNGYSNRLLYANGSARSIERFEEDYGRQRYNFTRFIQLLLKHNTPARIDMIEKYGVMREMIEKGMCCGTCGRRNLVRRYNTWLCLNCGGHDDEAHLQAWREFATLFGPTITRAEALAWLQTASRMTTYRLLQAFPFVNKQRYSYYDLSQLLKLK